MGTYKEVWISLGYESAWEASKHFSATFAIIGSLLSLAEKPARVMLW